MPTGLEARVRIDDNLKAALYELRTSRSFEEIAKDLRSNGHGDITGKELSKIHRAGKFNNTCSTVPYNLYVELVGKEPEEIRWRESINLARGIAYCYCFFFDVSKEELARQIVEDAKQQGLDCAVSGMVPTLFYDTRKTSINPLITDFLANKFNNATGKAQFSSLDEIEEFVNYRDSTHTKYRLVQSLRQVEDVLKSTGPNLTWTELQLIIKGRQNYGEEAFMEHIFPYYIEIKQQHKFPSEYFEMFVNYPNNINDNYKTQLGIIAISIGNRLLDYKKRVLDINQKRGFDLGVTRDGINMVLEDAMEGVHHNRNTNFCSAAH